MHRALVVSNKEVAKECLAINDSAVSGHPKLVAPKHLGYNYAMLALYIYIYIYISIEILKQNKYLHVRKKYLLKFQRINNKVIFGF